MTKHKDAKNFLTFDIEEWFHANYKSVTFDGLHDAPSTLPDLVDIFIDQMSQFSIKSTCFVVGTVAQKYPKMIKKLHDAGHEIASHSMHHRLVYSLTQKEFEQDTQESCDILQNIIGSKIHGYRAPSWSVRKDTLPWFYESLSKLGFTYSSSVFPSANYLYGIDGIEEHPHEVSPVQISRKLYEIPCSVTNIAGKKMGFSGGFYFRLLPYWFIKSSSQRINRYGDPVIFYLHPREIDINQKILALPWLEHFIHYWGVRGTLPKLERCMKDFSLTYIRMIDYCHSQS